MVKVYSTRYGRLCPGCEHPVDDCVCQKTNQSSKGDGVVRVRREVSGRRGKPVTTISGVPLDDPELKELARSFKQKVGTGGSVKNGVIEIQGDHREVLIADLKKRGYTVKKAGG